MGLHRVQLTECPWVYAIRKTSSGLECRSVLTICSLDINMTVCPLRTELHGLETCACAPLPLRHSQWWAVTIVWAAATLREPASAFELVCRLGHCLASWADDVHTAIYHLSSCDPRKHRGLWEPLSKDSVTLMQSNSNFTYLGASSEYIFYTLLIKSSPVCPFSWTFSDRIVFVLWLIGIKCTCYSCLLVHSLQRQRGSP